MSIDPEDVAAAAKGSGEVAKLGRDLYNDLAAPAGKEIGATIGATVRAALLPVRGLMWSIEQAELWLGERVAEKFAATRVPPERIRAPDPHVYAGVALGMLGAGHVEEVRELFAQLLASAMDKQSAAAVHPSFAEAIRQMSAKDAVLLRAFDGNTWHDVHVSSVGERVRNISISAHTPHLKGEILGMSREEADLGLANLVRLGLLEINMARTEPALLRMHEPGRELPYGRAQLSPYGRTFMAVCVPLTKAP